VIAACVSVLIGVKAKVYPITALAGLAAAPPVLDKLSAVGAGNNGPAFYGEMMDRTVKASSHLGLYLLGSLILSGFWGKLRGRRSC
jgi:1,4-dihydroxy-2-naphthoate octaprenyltransferase